LSLKMRIGIGHMFTETNSFSPVVARLVDFQPVMGQALIERWRGTRTELGGFLDILGEIDCEVAPMFSGWAITRGAVTDQEFERVKTMVREQVRNAGRLDGMLFALHGAMCAESVDDTEGALLEVVRGELGSEAPIVVTLDLHANLTRKMVDMATAIIAYRTNPHTDMYDTGRAAGAILQGILREEIRPVMEMQKIPLIVQAENMQTAHGPMAEVLQAGERFQAEHPKILSTSVFSVQPWLDIEEMGCATLAVADSDRRLASECARRMAQRFWDLRRDFEAELMDPKQAVCAALEFEGHPVVLSESSDSPTAGAPGDSVDMLRILLELAPRTPSAIWVRDPAVVESAWSILPGGKLRTWLGGGFDKVNRRPVLINGNVRALSDGRYTLKGGQFTGTAMEMGRTAVIEAEAISIVVSELPAFMLDPEVYRSQGIEPKDQKIVIVKSTSGFRSEYDPFAAKVIMVGTPGISSPNLQGLPYRRVSRPIYPLDPVEFRT